MIKRQGGRKMNVLEKVVKEDIAEFKKKMKQYVVEIGNEEIKSKSKTNYLLNKYRQRVGEGKAYNIKYEDYEQKMLEQLYKIMDEHNSKSRVRLYVSKQRISLRPAKTDVRHSAKTYERNRNNDSKKEDNSGLVIDFLEDEDKSIEMVEVENQDSHDSKSYILDVNLRELQAEKKDDYFHVRINSDRKLIFKEICKSKKLRMSDVLAQFFADVIGGKIQID